MLEHSGKERASAQNKSVYTIFDLALLVSPL